MKICTTVNDLVSLNLYQIDAGYRFDLNPGFPLENRLEFCLNNLHRPFPSYVKKLLKTYLHNDTARLTSLYLLPADFLLPFPTFRVPLEPSLWSRFYKCYFRQEGLRQKKTLWEFDAMDDMDVKTSLIYHSSGGSRTTAIFVTPQSFTFWRGFAPETYDLKTFLSSFTCQGKKPCVYLKVWHGSGSILFSSKPLYF